MKRALPRGASRAAVLVLLAALSGCTQMMLPVDGSGPQLPDASHTYLLHLPGMGGWMPAETDWLRGLGAGGASDHIEVFDWPALGSLIDGVQDYAHNRKAAHYLADRITEKMRSDPEAKIVLTAFSAGAAIAIWALEDLPDDVQVQSVLLVQAGVDPRHDLSRALRHVRGHMFSVYSGGDFIVLGFGTMIFGTADGGVHTAAAGQAGFRKPGGWDPVQYPKLVEVPYQLGWIKYGDLGEHVTQMSRSLARNVLAPMLIADRQNIDRG